MKCANRRRKGWKKTNSFRPESMRRWMKIVFLRLPDAFIHRQKGPRCGCARRTKMNRLSSSATISARMRRQRHLRPNKKNAPKINLSPVFYGVVWWSIERLHPSNNPPTSRGGVSSRQNLRIRSYPSAKIKFRRFGNVACSIPAGWRRVLNPHSVLSSKT